MPSWYDHTAGSHSSSFVEVTLRPPPFISLGFNQHFLFIFLNYKFSYKFSYTLGLLKQNRKLKSKFEDLKSPDVN